MSAQNPKETAASLVYKAFPFSLRQVYFIVRHAEIRTVSFIFLFLKPAKQKKSEVHIASPR